MCDIICYLVAFVCFTTSAEACSKGKSTERSYANQSFRRSPRITPHEDIMVTQENITPLTPNLRNLSEPVKANLEALADSRTFPLTMDDIESPRTLGFRHFQRIYKDNLGERIPKVLIVHDSSTGTTSGIFHFNSYFRSKGFLVRIDSISSRAECLARIQKSGSSFDIIVLNFGRNYIQKGLSTLSALKELENPKELKNFLIGCSDILEDREKYLKAGADFVLMGSPKTEELKNFLADFFHVAYPEVDPSIFNSIIDS